MTTTSDLMSSTPLRNNSDTWNVSKDRSMHVEALPVTPLSLTFASLMSVCILATIVGNVLVILSVFTYRPLRLVQNFYIVSLAIADLAVAVLVMPYNVVYSVLGYWPFGGPFCLVWATSDILTCTASILHLCAIAIDRYRAIHDPVAYAQMRTVRRVLVSVAVVWVVSAVISIPPLLGWNNSRLYDDVRYVCELTDEPTFVVYSASGSFYIPLVVMVFVYVKIFTATRARLRARAAASSAALTGTTIGMTNVALATVNAAKPEVDKTLNDACLAENDVKDRDNCVDGLDTNRSTLIAQLKAKPSENELNISPGNGDVSEASSPAHFRSLANGLSPRRFRKILMESTRRYGSRSRLAVDDDAVVRTTETGNHLTQFLAEKQRISLSRERRAARTMAIVMGAFVFCWLPFFVMYVAMSFCQTCQRDTDPRVVNFIVWLGYVNSSINPLIYTVFNVDFRRAFSALLRLDCRRSVAV